MYSCRFSELILKLLQGCRLHGIRIDGQGLESLPRQSRRDVVLAPPELKVQRLDLWDCRNPACRALPDLQAQAAELCRMGREQACDIEKDQRRLDERDVFKGWQMRKELFELRGGTFRWRRRRLFALKVDRKAAEVAKNADSGDLASKSRGREGDFDVLNGVRDAHEAQRFGQEPGCGRLGRHQAEARTDDWAPHLAQALVDSQATVAGRFIVESWCKASADLCEELVVEGQKRRAAGCKSAGGKGQQQRALSRACKGVPLLISVSKLHRDSSSSVRQAQRASSVACN